MWLVHGVVCAWSLQSSSSGLKAAYASPLPFLSPLAGRGSRPPGVRVPWASAFLDPLGVLNLTPWVLAWAAALHLTARDPPGAVHSFPGSSLAWFLLHCGARGFIFLLFLVVGRGSGSVVRGRGPLLCGWVHSPFPCPPPCGDAVYAFSQVVRVAFHFFEELCYSFLESGHDVLNFYDTTSQLPLAFLLDDFAHFSVVLLNPVDGRFGERLRGGVGPPTQGVSHDVVLPGDVSHGVIEILEKFMPPGSPPGGSTGGV